MPLPLDSGMGNVFKVIARGRNSTRSLRRGSCIQRHAETDALAHLPARMTRAQRRKLCVIVIRVGHDGELRMSKPCKHCIRHLAASGVKEVAYSTDDGSIVRVRTEELIVDGTPHVSKGFM